jgi:hypothetical protein
MFAADVDGDGDQDVITSLEAHGYGLAWFERSAEAGPFLQHLIAGPPGGDAETDILLHEPHAVAWIDVDGDGVEDIVSGERFWGHVPDNPDPTAPAQLVWFRRTDGPGSHFEAELIDDDSGVGTQLVARWLEPESALGIAIANKKGVFVFKRASSRPH